MSLRWSGSVNACESMCVRTCGEFMCLCVCVCEIMCVYMRVCSRGLSLKQGGYFIVKKKWIDRDISMCMLCTNTYLSLKHTHIRTHTLTKCGCSEEKFRSEV